jgi:GntR family histidine utilization transcriptional repressor
VVSIEERGSHSRVRQVEMELTSQILEGIYAPGDRLPSEAELVKRFGVSRQTIHKAIRELARCGLVERNRRAGTVVTRKFHQTFMLPLTDIREDVRKRNAVYTFKRQRQTVLCNGDAFIWSDLADKAEALYVELIHYSDDTPVMLETRHINLAAAPGARDVDFSTIAPSPWLLSNVPWSSVRHRIGALACGSDVAALLDLTPGAACMTIERKTYHLDIPITRVRMVLAGDRMDVSGDFTLSTL